MQLAGFDSEILDKKFPFLEIALWLSTSREVVSRLLKKLENDTKIVISRNKIDFTLIIS